MPRRLRPHHPAPGFHDAGHIGRLGGLMDVGNGGYSWAVTISETDGLFLSFYTKNLTSSAASYRAHGFQLRCLSE